MQLNTVTISVLYLLLSNAEGTVPASGPTLKVGSVASQLKEAASQSFLRTRSGHEDAVPGVVDVDGVPQYHTLDGVQDVHEEEDAEELKESSSDAVAEYDDTHETTNSSDMWAYERENDDGTVLTGTNPFENHTFQSLEEDDEPEVEQEEDEIPEEWTDPTNSTDEWAYEKANDDGTVLYGTNPLEAKGFVWEQDDLDDGEEPHEVNSDDEQQDDNAAHPENQVVLHAGTDSTAHDTQDDEWVTGEEVDDGTVIYGTNPLENQSDDDEEEADEMESRPDQEETDDREYNPDHVVALKANSTVNSTHDDEEEEYDDGTLDYGTNPMDMPDDDDEDYESNEEDAVVGLNSTQTDNEPEEYDDGTVLYGTNPLEPSDEEESNEQDATPSSDTKALPAPTPSQNVSKETTAQMAL